MLAWNSEIFLAAIYFDVIENKQNYKLIYV